MIGTTVVSADVLSSVDIIQLSRRRRSSSTISSEEVLVSRHLYRLLESPYPVWVSGPTAVLSTGGSFFITICRTGLASREREGEPIRQQTTQSPTCRYPPTAPGSPYPHTENYFFICGHEFILRSPDRSGHSHPSILAPTSSPHSQNRLDHPSTSPNPIPQTQSQPLPPLP